MTTTQNQFCNSCTTETLAITGGEGKFPLQFRVRVEPSDTPENKTVTQLVAVNCPACGKSSVRILFNPVSKMKYLPVHKIEGQGEVITMCGYGGQTIRLL